MSSVEFGLRPRGRIDRSTSPSSVVYVSHIGLRASTDRFNRPRRCHSDRGLKSRVIPAFLFREQVYFVSFIIIIIIIGGPAFLSSSF